MNNNANPAPDLDRAAALITANRGRKYRAWVNSITRDAIAAGRHYWIETSNGTTLRLEVGRGQAVGRTAVYLMDGGRVVTKGMPLVKKWLMALNQPAGPEKYGDYTQAEIDSRIC
jgi:hypothetical protein